MSFPTFDIEFTKDGSIFDANQLDQILNNLGGCTNLIVISHGWNNDKADAAQLYDQLFANVDKVLKALPQLSAPGFVVVRIFWPSKKFTDEELIPGGGAAAAHAANDTVAKKLLERLKQDPNRLGEQDKDAQRAKSLGRAQELLPKLDDAGARAEYVACLRAVLSSEEAHEDDGSNAFFTKSAEELFDDLKEGVTAPVASGGGGAADLSLGGGAASLGDLVEGVQAAARRLANFATYYQMKTRAATVGRTGVAQLLQAIRSKKGDVKLHLVGHSFGGLLVTAAASQLLPKTTAVTMNLLQAAYSHNGLSQKFDGAHDGFYRAEISEQRVSGPIVITHTKNDLAVGIAYPLASRIAHQQAAAFGDQNDPYGGMGRNGAQHTPEAIALDELQNVGGAYTFSAGTIYNVRSDRFIAGHNDITGPQVAYLLLKTAASI